MKTRSIRSRISILIGVALAIFSLVVMMGVFIYYRVQKEFVIRSTKEQLMSTTSAQIDSILVSFLIPEQRKGLEFLLQKFQEEDSLESVRVLQKSDAIGGFSTCQAQEETTVCMSDDGRSVAVISPIREGEQSYGYFFKSRKLDLSSIRSNILTVSMAVTFYLLAAFLIFMYFLAKITSIEIPRYVHDLSLWLRRALNDEKGAKPPQSRFEEFNNLTMQVDQAVKLHVAAKNQNLDLQKNAAIGQLASRVAHDMLSPLTTISGVVEKLKDGKMDKRRVETLAEASKTLEDIAEDLLKKKRQANGQELKKEKDYVLLADVLDSVLSDMEYHCSREGLLDLVVDSKIGLLNRDIKIRGDRTKLLRAINNIVLNAVQAMRAKSNGQPTLSVRLEEKNGSANLRISDNGPGIPAEIHQFIFKKSVSKNKQRGTGLGLLSAKEIIDEHGGAISFTTDGKGTTFVVEFPSSEELRTISLRGKSPVLVIDDDDEILRFWEEEFRKAGVECIVRKEIKSELLTGNYSGVISDYDLGDQSENGIEILKRFPATIPRYLCTGYGHDPKVLNEANSENILVLSKGRIRYNLKIERHEDKSTL